MLRLAMDDDALDALRGAVVPSRIARGVVYHVDRLLGEGGLSVALLAVRAAPEGETPVVLKVLRPSFVSASGATAAMMVQKEAVALGRLNERVPPTPFVVRLIDTGSLEVEREGRALELPWLVVEYVHGGAEGTTLAERVHHSVRLTGEAFGPARAANAVDAIARGLTAVHEVGVLHRDIKPENILCCGFGDDELFKVADFGVARPAGVAATFGGLFVGTSGYAAPELTSLDPARVGTWTDVFACAALAYYVLTGEDYFPSATPAEAMQKARAAPRRSVLEAPALSAELRARPDACAAIDAALATATAAKHERRPQTAAAFAASLLPCLRIDSRRFRPAQRIVDSMATDSTRPGGWRFGVRCRGGALDAVIRQVAWEGDGRCLAATTAGLRFWTGTEWRVAPSGGLADPGGVRFVRRTGAGRWLLGGESGTIAVYTGEQIHEVLRAEGTCFELFHGDPDDLAVMVGTAPGQPPTLYTLVGKRWLKPYPVADAARLTSLARVGDACWLVTGRRAAGGAFAALFSPLDFDLTPLNVHGVRAFLASAGQPDRRIGLAVGTGGVVLFCDRDVAAVERVEGAPDLAAASVDVGGHGWVASRGSVWLRQGTARWRRVWSDPTWSSPMVSMHADFGMVTIVSADGGVVEGRMVIVGEEGSGA